MIFESFSQTSWSFLPANSKRAFLCGGEIVETVAAEEEGIGIRKSLGCIWSAHTEDVGELSVKGGVSHWGGHTRLRRLCRRR